MGGRVYYVNGTNGESQWERPEAPATAGCEPMDLPPNWSCEVDPSSGRMYYVDDDGNSQWEPPTDNEPPLPPGWSAQTDDDGRVYYIGSDGLSQWDRPLHPAAGHDYEQYSPSLDPTQS